MKNGDAPIDVVLLDVRLSDENGLDILGEILHIFPRMPVIIITAYASIDTAVEAMRRGAFDYIPKPCTPEQLRQSLGRVERVRHLDNGKERRDSAYPVDLPDLDLTTGSTSSEMQEALDVAFKAASSDATVLLIGESGTGKHALARAIHRHGPRAARPFVPVNCSNPSQDALEKELFGQAEDAKGGAAKSAWGKIAAAEGGTLFLDEISGLPAEVQASLLRLLQQHEYERVGEADSRRANVRIIAATNHNLQKAVTDGKLGTTSIIVSASFR